jgi:hypothetical protein
MLKPDFLGKGAEILAELFPGVIPDLVTGSTTSLFKPQMLWRLLRGGSVRQASPALRTSEAY